MKVFIKGLIFGIGVVIAMVISVGAVYAIQLNQVNSVQLHYDLTPLGYEFIWLEDKTTPQELSIQLGVQVNQIQRGEIIMGYESDGNPIFKKGTKIIFNQLPSSNIITKLDFELGSMGYKRIGGKTIADTLLRLDTAVK